MDDARLIRTTIVKSAEPTSKENEIKAVKPLKQIDVQELVRALETLKF